MRVLCDICPHSCTIEEGHTGFCGARGNVGGKVVEKAYALDDKTIVGYTSMRYVMERWDPNYMAEMPLEVVEGLGLPVAAPKLEARQDG